MGAEPPAREGKAPSGLCEEVRSLMAAVTLVSLYSPAPESLDPRALV
jgi:hypothetical protein